MREVKLNESDAIKIHASAMTPYLYEKEFHGADMIGDISTQANNASMGVIDFGKMRHALWAMAKTANPARVPAYSAWMQTADLDYGEQSWIEGVLNEFIETFFRGAAQAAATVAG